MESGMERLKQSKRQDLASDSPDGGTENPVRVSAGRRAKIICTIGPACNSEPLMRDLMRLGMDVARLNFSHGTHDDHAVHIERLRRVAAEENRTICILQDLQGPKIRTGRLIGHTPVAIQTGSHLTITPREIEGTATLLSTTFKTLASEIKPGARILLSDGLIELRLVSRRGADIVCEVLNGGFLGEHQGINLPGAALSIPALTPKDRQDLDFGLKHGVDIIALSFVRSAADVLTVKRIIAKHGSTTPVIAKLEKPQALEHLEEIFEASDGVMVARGDLGVEMAPEKVPVIQKHIIRRSAAWRKPVITATQMLESMIENPRPTRAEASDVANAVFDGTDAVMLSAETASGSCPREAVAMMAKIVVEAESNLAEFTTPKRRTHRGLSIAETICESVAHAAEDLQMGAIAVFTDTGTTARLISKYRPNPAIHAFSHVPAVVNRMNLLWGVRPVLHEHTQTVEGMVNASEKQLLQQGSVKAGDVLGVVGGTRMSTGSTNFMRLHVVTAEEARQEKRARKTRAAAKPRS
jgi:pyruvate kinase